MAKLLYSARTADGKASQGFVEADSARQARDKLAASGLRDIVLHQEVGIASQGGALAAGLDPVALAQLAQFQLRLRAAPGLKTVMAEIARRGAPWICGDLLLLAYGLWTGRMLPIVVALTLLAFPFVRAAWMHRHADRYQELLKAFALGQWERVTELATMLRSAAVKSQQLAFDLDVRLAAIRARRGDLAGAARELEPWRAKLAASLGLFEARLASVHSAAGDREGFVRLMGQSYEASRHEPARTLDYALAHARYGDTAQAESLLAQLDASLLPPQGKGFLLWTRGLVALRHGGGDAPDLLGQATAEFLQRSAMPAAWTALAYCTCDHAIALSQAGRKEDAKRQMAHVWPIVAANADKPLMRLLQTEGLAAA
jgi:hypothetical protein